MSSGVGYLKKSDYVPYTFILPSVITIAVIIVAPFLLAIYMTFHQVDLVKNGGEYVFNGIKNFTQFFTDERALVSFIATLEYVVGAVTIELCLGICVSLLLNRDFKKKNIVRSLILIPFFITPVIGALIWNMFYEPTSGLLNYFLSLLSAGPVNWLGSTNWAMFSIILVDVWMTTPFMVLVILASMEGIPKELYEAARVDGARGFQVVRYVTLPLIKQAVVIATVLRTIDALKSFDIIYILTQGGPGGATETLNLYSYSVGFKYFKLGYATTIAFIFTLFVTVTAGFIISRFSKKS